MIETLLELLRTLTNPEKLIHVLTTVLTGWWGYGMLCGVIFAETGLLTGFFLPGDSLLFTVGVVAGAGHLDILLVNLALMAAAIVGDSAGYFLGRRTGPRIFNRPNSRFFHQEHLRATQEFYQKHGGKTVVIARFIPIIRTFVPFVAGIGAMRYRKFVVFEMIGTFSWVSLMLSIGFWFGNIPYVQDHLETVFLAIIIMSFLPLIGGILYDRLKKRSRPKTSKARRPKTGPSEE